MTSAEYLHQRVEGAPLFGRETDIAAVARTLSDPAVRFLTLTGPGGVGKSAVAWAVIRELRDQGAHVIIVDLAACETTDAARAILDSAVTSAVQVLDQPAGATQLYLVIESLEQLGSHAWVIGAALAANPALRVLGTSRVPSGISSEYRQPIAPLRVVGPEDSPDEDVPESDRAAARQLFHWHARRVSPRTDAAEPFDIVTAICRRLDGLPLALEIAANQIGVMNHAALLARLENGWAPHMRGPSDLPQRHQTLAATFDDNTRALSPDDRSVLALFSAFEGSVEPAAVTVAMTLVNKDRPDAPMWDENKILDHLTSLVQHSLLIPTADSPDDATIFFSMQQLTRDCARQILLRSSDGQVIRSAHADYFLRRVQVGVHPTGAAVDTWLERTDHDLDDIRSALRFLVETGDQRALDLAAGMRNYWRARGLLREGIDWLTEVLALSADNDSHAWLRAFEARTVLLGAANSYASVISDLAKTAELWRERGEPLARARTLIDLGAAVFEAQGFQSSQPLFEEAIEVLDQAGDRWWAARARSLLGASAAAAGEHREFAMLTLDRAIEDFRSLGDVRQTNLPLQQLGRILHEEGHDVHAAALLTEGLTLAQDAGDAWNTSVFLNLLAEIELARGHFLIAARNYLQSLELAVGIDAKPRFIWCLEGLAAALTEAGETKYPARLIGLAVALRSTLNLQNWVEFPAKAIDVTSVQSSLPRANFEALRSEGYRMSVGDVLEYVPQLLAEREAAATQAGQRRRYPDGLTNREVEVLKLIAAGNTSRSIASTLFVSIETVGRHISNLYRKIGASGRAEATAYAIRSGLIQG